MNEDRTTASIAEGVRQVVRELEDKQDTLCTGWPCTPLLELAVQVVKLKRENEKVT